MVRQKVKGTGHKQPADAQTEPNFYALPPVSAGSASAGTSPMISPAMLPAVAPSSPLGSASPASSATRSHFEMSPGTQCVHGAAFLLKGIAAGLAPSRLSNIDSTAAVASIGSPVVSPALDASASSSTGNSAASGFSLTYRGDSHGGRSHHGQQGGVISSAPRQNPEQTRVAFTARPPPRSSYSSLLWGAEAAPTANSSQNTTAAPPDPPASFLWPQSATAPSASASKEKAETTGQLKNHEAV